MAKYKDDLVSQAILNGMIIPQLFEPCEQLIFPIQVFFRQSSCHNYKDDESNLIQIVSRANVFNNVLKAIVTDERGIQKEKCNEIGTAADGIIIIYYSINQL
jgi:hypothetical protein